MSLIKTPLLNRKAAGLHRGFVSLAVERMNARRPKCQSQGFLKRFRVKMLSGDAIPAHYSPEIIFKSAVTPNHTNEGRDVLSMPFQGFNVDNLANAMHIDELG